MLIFCLNLKPFHNDIIFSTSSEVMFHLMGHKTWCFMCAKSLKELYFTVSIDMSCCHLHEKGVNHVGTTSLQRAII